jgi:hypothetical protein
LRLHDEHGDGHVYVLYVYERAAGVAESNLEQIKFETPGRSQ